MLKPFIAPTSADVAKFDNPTTPQSKALAWLKNDMIANSPQSLLQTVLDRYALAVVYYSTASYPAGGPFLNGDSFCTWVGVQCSADMTTVTSFSIAKVQQESPQFPWEVVLMRNLVKLRVDGGWAGQMPARQIELKKLEHFSMIDNSFDGILWNLGLLTELKVLILTNNKFKGPIPPSLGNLKKLNWLDLRNNQLTGGIPVELGALIDLQYLSVGENLALGGTIPNLSALQKLIYLYMDKCNLSGSLPTFLGAMPSLRYVIFHKNNLSGQIPAGIGGTDPSKGLQMPLACNQFSGNVHLYCQAYAPVSTSKLLIELDRKVGCSCPGMNAGCRFVPSSSCV